MKTLGYRVELTFIALDNPDAHVARVSDRVAAGLHGIPEERIRERYARSMERAVEAVRFIDHTLLLDNSSTSEPFRPVAEFDGDHLVAVVDDIPRWAEVIVSRLVLRIQRTNPTSDPGRP